MDRTSRLPISLITVGVIWENSLLYTYSLPCEPICIYLAWHDSNAMPD